jgi:hypothetical protein
MLIELAIGDYSAAWHFPGSQGLNTWLADTPWLADGGVAIVHLPNDDDGFEFAQAIARQIHGYDAGSSNPRVESLDGDELAQGLTDAVARWFRISPDATAWQTREALAQAFAKRPTCLLFMPAETERVSDPWGDAIDLLDVCSKSPVPSTPTFILLDNARQRYSGRRSFDFTRGRPLVSILDSLETGSLGMWQAYLHVRLAWESGGDPVTARAMYAKVFAELTRGDDEGLERALNEWALSRFDQVSTEDCNLLADCLGVPRDTGVELSRHAKDLETAGLVWRPWGTGQHAPVPWVARALLCREPNHHRSWLLRSSLVCRPLVNEILGYCQNLEQQLKASVILPSGDGGQVPDEVLGVWQRYREGRDDTTYYPNAHPSPPTRPEDVWFFASLGQFLRSQDSPLSRRYSDAELKLSRLRNTMAHGHYASWMHLCLLKEIMLALSS